MGLQSRILELQKGFRELQAAILTSEDAPFATSILFSQRPQNDSVYYERLKELRLNLKHFIENVDKHQLAYEKAQDLQHKDKLADKIADLFKRLSNAYHELTNLFKFLFNEAELKEKDHQQMLVKLRQLAEIDNNNPHIRQMVEVLREYTDAYRQFKDKAKDQFAKPDLTHDIVKQQHEQMRYDPLGRIAAYLMGLYLETLLLKNGIEPLPKRAKNEKDEPEDRSAVSEMMARQASMANATGASVTPQRTPAIN